jgi:hypothetical protein
MLTATWPVATSLPEVAPQACACAKSWPAITAPEAVVIDSDSADRTADQAARAGATVYRARDIAPELGTYPGKGEALWKSLLVTEGDLLVFVDADLTCRRGPARTGWNMTT